MNVNIEVSIGEFFDKLVILEIKTEKMDDAKKLVNVRKELEFLNKHLKSLPLSRDDISSELEELKQINSKLWDIEDDIREKERNKEFDDGFVELSRSVYQTNDRRCEVKRDINLKLGSDFVEEKSYEEY